MLHPKLRKFIWAPIAINCLLFLTLTATFFNYYDTWLDWLVNWIPSGFGFISTALKALVGLLIFTLVIIAYSYSFNIITNIVAAPFYGLLAQRTEELITGKKLPEEAIINMIARTLYREIQKLLYFLVRGLIIFLLVILLGTIPIINMTAPIIGLLWGAWTMALQYTDYAADNNQLSFRRLRKKLRQRKYSSVGFGGAIMLCSMIPVINIIAIPASVVGGTLFWINELEALRKVQVKPKTR